jgi:DNA-binding NtrC family response regulator
MEDEMQLKRMIAKIEKHQRDLENILAALREFEGAEPLRVGVHRSLDQQEKRIIARVLREVNYNQSAAARILQISRDRLRYKIAKHRLSIPPTYVPATGAPKNS